MRENDIQLKAAMNEVEEKYGMEARTKVNEIISDALKKDQPLTTYEIMYVAELLSRAEGNYIQ